MAEPLRKEETLEQARVRVASVRETIAEEIRSVGTAIDGQYRGGEDLNVRTKLLRHFSERLDQLHHLFSSPFFVRCDVRSADGDAKTVYFAKFPKTDESIFSWMAPASRLRFSDIGPASYALPDGTAWQGDLLRKDQFMIVGGKIVFLSSEATTYGRTLVYQEQLSKRKAGFMLPEIVERMERAQDDVIRAPEHGSFLIAGPAGSGKTTLAFHRIAYLLQSPDTASRFQSHDVIVLVQDEGTRDYFCRLLPDLGIHDVTVTTFGQWALERLGLGEDYRFVRRPNGVDEAVDAYEGRKCEAMRTVTTEASKRGDAFARLKEIYAPSFSKEDEKRFAQQKKDGLLDRFDLSVLLRIERQRAGAFTREEEYFVQKKNFEVTRKRRTVPLTYSLIVVDEAQNYLPEQIVALRSCASPSTNAILYVGDLGQQVLVGTLRDWGDAGETFAAGQKVQLEKVYRNTRAILRYVGELGFGVSVPDELREGAEVVDGPCATVEEMIERVRAVVTKTNGEAQVGVLGLTDAGLEPFATAFAGQANVHVLTVHEAQGVEFEIVCVVGIPEDFLDGTSEERGRIKRDLVYVALTRAMDELHVFGATTLAAVFGG
ncbi:MAG: ATP-binding domain-containing protein [Candidatus Uhrbacteria bacterium]